MIHIKIKYYHMYIKYFQYFETNENLSVRKSFETLILKENNPNNQY